MNCPKCNHPISEGTRFCPNCGAAIVADPEPVAREAPQEGAAQIEVEQQVGTVEGGRVVGVDLGEVLGDVNIGNYTLRIGTLNGGVVNVAPPQQRRDPQPRPVPVMLLPRPFSGFLDRSEEVSAATAVLEGASPVEFYGPPGVGKTVLLHYLAHHEFAPVFPAGVVFFSEIRHRPVDDLLLDFFDAFYERDPTYIPTSVQVRQALQEERALVVLDDVDLEREDIEALMDAAPACVFLSASTERRLWSGGRTIALRGLPPEEALTLIERDLGRPLGEEERTVVQRLYEALEGYPLRLLQLSALVRDDGISLADVAERLRQHNGPVGEALADQTLAQRSEPERRVLAALAVPMGASVGEQHLNELAGVDDARPALESLQRRHLVQAHSPRYSLTGSVDEALREQWDLSPWN
ncbi:MAG: zinc-ribbon domain-containing protein, partial [Actinomycetota bacterium]|nr:zinc-ribbon domain-containing protein [Actinomycetota bacterium]